MYEERIAIVRGVVSRRGFWIKQRTKLCVLKIVLTGDLRGHSLSLLQVALPGPSKSFLISAFSALHLRIERLTRDRRQVTAFPMLSTGGIFDARENPKI